MTRTSTEISLVPPTGRTVRSCNTRSSLTCMGMVISPISSRKIVPWSATSNNPRRFWFAPVKAPLTYPKSSLSSRVSGNAPQLTETKASAARGEQVCTARATSSLPVPLSQKIRTVLLVVATVRMVCFNFSRAGLTPTMLSSELRVPASRRRAKF